MKRHFLALFATLTLVLASACTGPSPERDDAFDVLIRGGTIYDGSGQPGVRADIGIRGDRISAVGDLSGARADRTFDATGQAVAPGFINMLSWGMVSLLDDGRGLSDIAQGVTLEVFGEGHSMGPVPQEGVDPFLTQSLGLDPAEELPWRTLGGFLEYLEDQGVSPNVASFVGATTVRQYVLSNDDRAPDEDELEQMQALVAQAMEEGALGVGSSLIYPPAFFADTDELVALAQTASGYGGMYISHMRSEGDSIEASVEELIAIARRADIPAEIYHLKFAGRQNWGKFDDIIARIEAAREEGLAITADMYTYPAGATGLTASLPPWSGEGGLQQTLERLKDPAARRRIIEDMTSTGQDWENLLQAAGPEGVLLAEFHNPALARYAGKTLAEVAAERGTTPEETALDLIALDESRVETLYFMMSEENLARKVALPWLSFGSDAEALTPETTDTSRIVHPRSYGTFARVLGKYVREEGRLSLTEAVRKLSSLPAENLGLERRGRLAPGYYADVVVFDPATVGDRATYDAPHQLAVGVSEVLVNGVPVLVNGEHTGAMPGRFIRGPGYRAP